MRYTAKQIEKYKRQKYINSLEKVTKNLFKMFRNRNINQNQFLEKFKELKDSLDKHIDINLNSEYHDKIKSYIDRLYSESQDNFILDDVREINMRHLNRLQKLKNQTSYKKDKHRYRSRDEDWG